MNGRARRASLVALTLWTVGGCTPARPADWSRIEHIVVIYQENHSFDNLFGEFPGAEGLTAAMSAPRQTDPQGNVYPALPRPMDAAHGAVPDSRFPESLPNAPFPIEDYVPSDQNIPDLVHRYYQHQAQIHGGKNDRFVAISNAKALTMGYYATAGLPIAPLARQFTVCDRFFAGAFGGSLLNHMYLVALTPPRFPTAPREMVAVLGPDGYLADQVTDDEIGNAAVTPDGYVVNTAYTVNTPHPANIPQAQLVPSQTMPTIGDYLSDKAVSWAWYSGGWSDAVAGRPDVRFQHHHQPFAYFTRYADGTAARAEHLRDEEELLAAARAGTLPAVAFVKPIGWDNEHPGYTDLARGQQHLLSLITAIQASPEWSSTAIIVTYDENGGFWDHVAPPVRDQWGPGSRVPTIVISPYAKRGFVDSTVYETASILRTLERRFGLPSLGAADAAAADLSNAFDFTQAP